MNQQPKNSQETKVQDHMAWQQTFIEELILILIKLLQKSYERKLPNVSYEANISLVLKLDNETTEKENYRPTFPMNMDKKSPK